MKTIFSNDEFFYVVYYESIHYRDIRSNVVKAFTIRNNLGQQFWIKCKYQKVLQMDRKTVRKREMLVTSNFSFSHCVFKRLVLQTPINQGLFGNELTPSQTTNFTLYQIERFCRRQNEFNENGRKLSKRIENTGKRRNCLLWAISPFPTLFSKDIYCRHL